MSDAIDRQAVVRRTLGNLANRFDDVEQYLATRGN